MNSVASLSPVSISAMRLGGSLAASSRIAAEISVRSGARGRLFAADGLLRQHATRPSRSNMTRTPYWAGSIRRQVAHDALADQVAQRLRGAAAERAVARAAIEAGDRDTRR